MSKQDKSTVYVISVSDHGLPNLLAVCSQVPAPEKVLMLVTDDARFQEPANRLESVIKEKLPMTQVDRLPTFSGDSMTAIQTWIKQHFLKYYRKNKKNYWILNATGGTKIMPMALERVIKWDEIHYKSLKENHLQSWNYKKEKLRLQEDIPFRAVDLMDVVNTYQSETTITENNMIELYDQAIIMAEKIWEQYAQESSPHKYLSEKLEKIWYGNDKNTKILWKDIPENSSFSIDEFKTWCQQLTQLLPSAVNLDDEGITVPAKEKEGVSSLTDEQNAWKKWVSGFWLETLIGHWMTNCVDQQSIVRNLRVRDKTSQDVLEVDFLMLYKNNLSMIEAKVSPSNKTDSVNKIIKDINAINSLGNLKKYLMISPLFEQKMKPKEQEDFHERCRFYNINILRSKEELLKAFQQ